MMRWFFATTACLALIASGLVHGFWSDRWQPPVETKTAAARLDDVPGRIGDWDGKALEVKPGQAGAGVAGCIQRSYVNTRTGTKVVMALVCGRPGPVSIHTPEACYVASGYAFSNHKKVGLADGPDKAELWQGAATKTSISDETRQRVFWG